MVSIPPPAVRLVRPTPGGRPGRRPKAIRHSTDKVDRRSRDGAVVLGRDHLSVACGDSSPERGAFPLRRVHPSGAPRQLPLTRGALGTYKTRKSPRKKVQTSKSGLHLLLTANIQPQLLTNSVSCIRRRVVKNS